MRTAMIRATLCLTVLVALGGVVGTSPVNAAWANCPPGTTVAYNPTNGHEIRVGYANESDPVSARPVWLWVCVDDGGTLGSQSIGTASYVTPNGYPAVLQHVVTCPSVTPDCPGAMVGATVFPPTAGSYGAKPCVSAGAQDGYCVSVGVTPGTVPAAATPGSGSACIVNVAGVCPSQVVTVRVGGTVLTLYVDGSPTFVTVPDACARTDWAPPILTVQPGTGC